jgi:ABC-type Zn uptake system ZnuABC Zn-binding protein ZnuA
MDREVAQIIATTASRVASELTSLMPFLKEHGEGQKDDAVRHAMASAIYEVGSVRDAVFEQYPDLKSEFEARLKKYGRYSY